MTLITNVALAVMIAFAGPVLALHAARPDDGIVLVVTMPWTNSSELVAKAGGWEVGPDTASLAVLASSNLPGFSDRLHEAGALWVRDGRLLAKICGVPWK